MATPPPVTAADASAAIERIRSRRVQIDDPNLWRMSDDPADVLLYLRRHGGRPPQWVAQADVLDAVTLRLRLWWMGEEAELWLLEAARRHDVPLSAIGQRLGIGSRQGVHDRLRLVRKKLQRLTGQPHPAFDPPRSKNEEERELTWLTRHRREILDVAAEAVVMRDLADDEAADWLIDVARDLGDRIVTPGSLQTLRFALAELEVSTAVLEAGADHPVRELLSRWEQLYATRPG